MWYCPLLTESIVPEPQSQLIVTIAIGAGVLLALIFCTCIIGISLAWIKFKRYMYTI